jgi:hypothetical protein
LFDIVSARRVFGRQKSRSLETKSLRQIRNTIPTAGRRATNHRCYSDALVDRCIN